MEKRFKGQDLQSFNIGTEFPIGDTLGYSHFFIVSDEYCGMQVICRDCLEGHVSSSDGEISIKQRALWEGTCYCDECGDTIEGSYTD